MITTAIDLRPKLPAVRNQGGRKTCMAFAASGAHAQCCGTPALGLSVEYAHYQACLQRATFNPHQGTSVIDMFAALSLIGQPEESSWPYGDQLPDDLSSYHPPAAASILFKHTGNLLTNFDDIVLNLENGKPVLIGVNLSTAFHFLRGTDILQFDPSSDPAGHHAVVIVGAREVEGRLVFLVRNSWGDGWADRGHGHISETYLRSRATFMGVFCD